MIELGFKGSNDPENKFRFKCPVVKTETKLLDCYERRRGYMRAEIIDRADCRCALTGGKCPARRMLDEEYHVGKRLYFDPVGKELKPLPKPLLDAVERVILVAGQADGQPLSSEEATTLGVRLRAPVVVEPEEFKEAPAPPAARQTAKPAPVSVGGYRTQADMCRSLIKEGLPDADILEQVKAVFPTFKQGSINYYREQVGVVVPVVKAKPVKAKAVAAEPETYKTQAAMCRALIGKGVDDNTIFDQIKAVFPAFKFSSIAYYRLQVKS